jgi:hypothetical protein
MEATLVLSEATLQTAGVLLVAIVTIEFGGTYLLRVVQGAVPLTGFQQSFARAGHAHAGVLVSLGLICQLFVNATELDGAWRTIATVGVPAAAILMPAGFFFSSMGKERTSPNGFSLLIWLGAASLAAGTLTLGIGLLAA